MRLNVVEREALRKRVKILIPQMKKSEIVNHFVLEGIAKSTIYDAINRLQNGGSLKDKKKTGRPTSWTSAKKSRLKRLTNNRKGVSQRRLGRKFGVSQTTIGNQLLEMGISCFKREKTPKYTEKQAQKAKILSEKLANFLYRTSCSIIMDDEKYFCYNGDQMPGSAYYYTDNKENCPDSIRFAGKEKFPGKVLVWVAISSRGISKPLFRPSKSEAVDSNIYINQCLEERLLPFIHEYHSDSNYVFWPDLAGCHYSNRTVAWMNENIKFVPKALNPPNIPQARPIENFWGSLAQKVYEGGWEAQTEQQMINRIKCKIKEFDVKSVESLMRGIKAKVKSIGVNGVYFPFK